MANYNTDIGRLRKEVLKEVAKLTFDGELEEKKDDIPFHIIKGHNPQFRCCVYREREIIRQRVRLAEGKCANDGEDKKTIVQVINSACEGCPITRFIVTENCQKCLAKKCQEACNFNAITMTRHGAYIDPKKCKECGRCAASCPYNAIADLMRPCKKSCPVDAITMDEDNLVKIDEEKCINCGSCIANCPFGAISDKSFIVDVIKLLKSGREVYAMVAPAIEGQFGKNVTIGMLESAIKDLGFTGMYEVSLGADYVAAHEAEELKEALANGEKMTTSCCPAFVAMIRKHFPTLVDKMSNTVSPMAAIGHLVKEIHPGACAVFIGPCIAKKQEVLETVSLDGADYAITFEELSAMFQAKDIDPSVYNNELQQGSIYGKHFSNSGGVTAAVLQALKEAAKGEEVKVNARRCDGAVECKKALMLLKNNKLPEDFIEGMACIGGCMNGPAAILSGREAALARDKQLSLADDREILENIKQYENFDVGMERNL